MAKRQVDYLNNESPVFRDVALGSKLDAMITLLNEVDTQNTGVIDLANEIRTQNTDVVDLLNQIRTQYAALMAKLDADGGVTDVNYAATVGLTEGAVSALTEGAVTTDPATAVALLNGMRTQNVDVVALANEIRTQYAALLAKLDADGGIETDYAATVGLTEGAVSALTSPAAVPSTAGAVATLK
jgi:hypothetical protein